MVKSLSGPRWPCWDPLAAILCLTRGAVLQAVSGAPVTARLVFLVAVCLPSCTLVNDLGMSSNLSSSSKTFWKSIYPTNLIPQAQYQIHLPFLNFLLMQPQLTLEEFRKPSFLFKFWLMNCIVSLKVPLKSVSSIKKIVKIRVS